MAKKTPPKPPHNQPSQIKRRRSLLHRPHKAESAFRASLRQVAKQVGALVKAWAPEGGATNTDPLIDALKKYAEILAPWSEQVARRMISDVNARSGRAWRELSSEVGFQLGTEIVSAPTGARMQERMAEQVSLITSLPLQAAQRVHDLTMTSIVDGTRAATIAKEILATSTVTESRATLIARTEVARTTSVLTQARAEYAGSEGYIWRTSGDRDVRDSHAEMEGKYVRWSNPPLLSDGTRTHAGQIYNCRCWSDPVFEEND